MGINEIIMYIMMFFMLIAAVDRILSQFGGSARFLGKFGKSIEGSGGQFEEGFMAMGALGLAMVGMTALAPVLAHVLGPVIIPVYEMLGANPSMFAGTLLACDMGGFFLAKELAGGDVAAWLYSGLILGSMMGPTIVFSIPVALGIIEPSDRRYLALGVLAGIVTIPIGCIAGGLVAMYSGVQINGQPVEFTFALILMNMIPVLIVAVLVALGLKFIPEKMINGFQIFAKFLVALITLGLAAAVVKFLLGWELIPGLDPIFMAPGDKPGEVMRAIEVIGSISCVLLGAYPMVLLLTRWFEKPLMSVGKVLNMNNIAAAGMVATLANNIPMFGMMKQMDTRGKVINCAFAVSAAFALGDHLGFAAANMNAMIFPMIVEVIDGTLSPLAQALMQTGLLPAGVTPEIITLSGGVGECYRHQPADPFCFADIGPLLATALHEHPRLREMNVQFPAQTVRATVIGAGAHTLSLSGSTIWLEGVQLPLRNLPVAIPIDETDLVSAWQQALIQLDLCPKTDAYVLALPASLPVRYAAVLTVINALVDFVARFPNPHPLLVVAGQDFGKALGMLLRPQLQQLPLAVIDEVIVRAGDYIDIGTPLFGGSVVPVTVKSLAFPS
ncbi:TPA: ethanolamine utilization protein EutH [Escherichia coli]